MSDQLFRFLFDEHDVRGEHVFLEQAYSDILDTHHYPPGVAMLLGEFLAAASLLASIIKFDGRLILQVRGSGEVPLIMAEADSNGALRAIARNAERAIHSDFRKLVGEGQLAITIDPAKGNRYQGIVSLDGKSLAACLENYFMQSEQLATRIWLQADGQQAAGLLLQQLPKSQLDESGWQHLSTLADTVQARELLSLGAETLLYRLFHEDALRLFDGKPLRFECSCNKGRFFDALRSLGEQEIDNVMAEQGQVETQCEFCNRIYRFGAGDVAEMFGRSEPPAQH